MPVSRDIRLGPAWLALCATFALHIADEALTGFLAVYNPTVIVLRSRYSWFPMPVFEFRDWLTGLILLVVVVCSLSPFFFHNARWVRPVGYFFAVVNVLNALGHTAGTILGRTVASVSFSRPAPGFWSSPFLFVASVWLLVELQRSGAKRGETAVSSARP